MIYRVSCLALLACLSASLMSCTSTVSDTGRKERESAPQFIESDHRVNAPANLRKKIGLVSLNQTTVSGNLLQVQATLVNRTSRTQACNYRFEWIDENGMHVQSPTDIWQSLTFMGRESKSVSAVATNPKVVDFRFKLIEK